MISVSHNCKDDFILNRVNSTGTKIHFESTKEKSTWSDSTSAFDNVLAVLISKISTGNSEKFLIN